jgi:carbamoyltransferase
MWILSIQKQANGSVCLLKDGEVVFHLMEERISRVKKFPTPFKCIQQIKNYTCKLDLVVFTGYDCVSEENQLLYQMLMQENLVNESQGWTEYSSHHMYHAANAFYNSGFDKALCIVWDGQGSTLKLTNQNECSETTTVFDASYPANLIPIYKRVLLDNRHIDYDSDSSYNKNNTYAVNKLVHDIPGCHIDFRYDLDIGTMYQAVSNHLGFGSTECGKTMGLAAYGKEDDTIPPIMIGDHCNMNLFVNRFHLNNKLYPNLNRENLAHKLQKTIEQYGSHFVQDMLHKTGHTNLVISGGVGLNVCLNYYLRKHLPQNINIYVEPNCEDSGNAVGAAKLMWYIMSKDTTKRPIKNCYLGPKPEYNLSGCKTKEASHNDVIDLLVAGEVIGLFQGSSEAGPRALGNRSILFDPRIPNGKDIVNGVKNREWFRPFAASVLEEECHNWFDMAGLANSPYMMYAVDVLPDRRDKIPSVVHVDGTCRVQTVNKEQNEHYYNLIKMFAERTGVPLLFNTSFNLAGEPMVETLEDVIRSMNSSKINYVYLPEVNKIIYK